MLTSLPQKSPKTIILIISMVATIFARVSEQHFYLNPSDKLCINIDNILPQQYLLNDLKVSSPADLKIEIPSLFKSESIPDFFPAFDKSPSIVHVSSFGKFISLLVKEEKQHWIVIKEVDTKTKQSNTEKLQIASNTDECLFAFIDESSAYTACFSTFEKTILFCSLNYIDREDSKCQPLSFDLKLGLSVEKAKVGLDFYHGPDGSKLFALYYISASPSRSARKQFYLADLKQQSLMSLHDEVDILKVTIAAYNKHTKEAVLLILVEEKGVRSLRHYSVIDSAFVETEEGQWFRLVKEGISDFVFKDKTLITTVQEDKKPLVISDIDFNDLSLLDFPLEGQVAVRQIAGSSNFFAFETEDSHSEPFYSLFDTRNHRFLNIPNVNKNRESFHWIIVPIGFGDFLFFFNGLETSMFQLRPFQDVCLWLSEGLGGLEKTVQFFLKSSLIFKAIVTSTDFDFVKEEEEAGEKIVVQGAFLTDAQKTEQLIHLGVKGNNLQFSEESPVYFFHQIQRADDDQNESPEELYCPVSKALIKNRSLVILCDDGRLISHKDFSLDRKSKEYSFELKSILDTQLDTSKITVIRLLFGEFLLMIDEKKNVFYLSLEAKEKGSEVRKNDILVQFEECLSEKHRFLCKNQNEEIFVIEALKSGESLDFVQLNSFYLPKAIFQSIVVSASNSNLMYYIRQSFHKENVFHLIKEVDSVASKMNTGEMKIFKDSTIIEISDDELVLVNESLDEFSIFGFIGDSQIRYLFPRTDRLHYIIDYAVIEEAKMFCLLYKTIDGEMYLYVARSSLEAYDRVVKDQYVGPFEDGASIEAHFITKYLILFFVYAKHSAEGQYSFVYFLNSPMYSLASDAPLGSLFFRLNGHNYIRQLEQLKADTSLEIDAPNVSITGSKSKKFFYDLEGKGKLKITGDLMQGLEISPASGFTFVPRLKLLKRHNIRKSKEGFDSNLSTSLSVDEQSFVLFFNDFFYRDNEGHTNKKFKDCKAVGLVADDASMGQLFFCKDKETGRCTLTNHGDIAIELEGVSHKFTKIKTLKAKNELFVAGLNASKKQIYFFKFISKDNEFSLEFRKKIAANDFNVNVEAMDDFFMFNTIVADKIVFLIHLNFTPEIIVKEFDCKSDVFDKQASSSLTLFDKNKIFINEAYCLYQGKQVSCLIRGDQFIYDTSLETKGGAYLLKINTRYPFNESYFIESKLNYAITPNYISVLTHNSESGFDALVFRRDFKQELNKIFSAVKINEGEKIARIQLLEGVNKDPSRLFVAFFSEQIENSSFYKSLYVDEYQLGPFGLDIEREATSYRKTLELNFISRDNGIKKVYLNVVLDSNLKHFILTIVLLGLVAVLIGLVAAVVSVYHTNRKLKMEVDPNIADQSAFVNRTQFQI